MLLPAAAAMGDEYTLVGVVRDFKESHTDMQRPAGTPAGVYEDMVLKYLGADGKPQLNIGEISCHFGDGEVTVISVAHEISNVVLKYDDGTTYKFDDQSGHTHTYPATPGKEIVGCWVKAGANHSYDGSGYGTYFSPESILTYEYIPAEWRVESAISFGQWFRNEPDVNISMPLAITLEQVDPENPYVYSYARDKNLLAPYKYFFPIDGAGWNDSKSVSTGTHNFYFTFEVHTEFVYTDPAERAYEMYFTFSGDDDVWVFINGKLAIDLGGVHGQATRTISLDGEDAEDLGLVIGETFALDFFFAERKTDESNFRIETTIPLVGLDPGPVSPLYD